VSRLLPTGECWCGCKTPVDLGSFFAAGHDKRAEARVIMEVFGGVPQFLAAFGRVPESAKLMNNIAGMPVEVSDESRQAVLRAVTIRLDEIKALLAEMGESSR